MDFVRLLDPGYWRALNTPLHITDTPFAARPAMIGIASPPMERHVQRLVTAGYFQTEPVIPSETIAKLIQAVSNTVQAGIPAAFAFVYDEFWSLYRDLAPVLTPAFGPGYKLVANFWAWHIEGESAGFKPHRDTANLQTLTTEGMPWYATVWIPLTDVSPLHSCMFLLPTNHDANIPNRLTEQAVPYDQMQSIRALPAPAGSVLCWNPLVLHWGSRSDTYAARPRISIATTIQRREVTSLRAVELHPGLVVPFNFRLAVIADALLQYRKVEISAERYDDKLVQLCQAIVQRSAAASPRDERNAALT